MTHPPAADRREDDKPAFSSGPRHLPKKNFDKKFGFGLAHTSLLENPAAIVRAAVVATIQRPGFPPIPIAIRTKTRRHPAYRCHYLVMIPGHPSATLNSTARIFRHALAACGLFASACATAASGYVPLTTNASGVFVNDRGDVLTARHAVANCKSLYAVKDGKVSPATIRAIGDAQDIAVVGTDLQPYLTATFSHSPDDGKGGKPVFAESYEALQLSKSLRGTLFNALTVPGGGLSLMSPARPGASGSAVLDSGGLYLGMIVERIALAPSGGAITLSATAQSAAADHAGASHVKAVPVQEITAFLRANNIPYTESDVPQLETTQAVAPRATTLAVGIICG
jgi:hypothetical protein